MNTHGVQELYHKSAVVTVDWQQNELAKVHNSQWLYFHCVWRSLQKNQVSTQRCGDPHACIEQ